MPVGAFRVQANMTASLATMEVPAACMSSFVVVDKGKGEEAMDAARAVGAGRYHY